LASTRKKPLRNKGWQEVRSLFERCLALTPVARDSLLTAATKGKPRLRQEVERLLAASEVPDEALGRPVIARMAENAPVVPAPTTAVQPLSPERIGKYLIVHRLGQGGMAEVFLAKMLGPGAFDRLVAVKRIRHGLSADPASRGAFEDEARITSRLTHGNIVHLYDFFEADNAYFFAMELVNGTTLGELIERAAARGRLAPEVGAYIIARIAEGLDYAHRLKSETTGEFLAIVHRDISPKNVLVSFDGEIKIVDFGIAKATGKESQTRTGFIRGTVGYLSPEAVRGGKVDRRSDLFSTCLLLYEILAGSPLFAGENTFTTLRAVEECDLPVPRIAALELDDDLKAILRRGLAKDPERRFQTAAELRAALEAYLTRRKAAHLPESLAGLMQSWYSAEIDDRRKQIADCLRLTTDARGSGEKKAPRFFAKAFPYAIALAALLGSAFTYLAVRVLPIGSERNPSAVAIEPPAEGAHSVTAHSLCADETQALCPGRHMGHGLGECLVEHRDQLSEGCLNHLKKAVPFMFENEPKPEKPGP
jgi:serine/threonine protein kinase